MYNIFSRRRDNESNPESDIPEYDETKKIIELSEYKDKKYNIILRFYIYKNLLEGMKNYTKNEIIASNLDDKKKRELIYSFFIFHLFMTNFLNILSEVPEPDTTIRTDYIYALAQTHNMGIVGSEDEYWKFLNYLKKLSNDEKINSDFKVYAENIVNNVFNTNREENFQHI